MSLYSKVVWSEGLFLQPQHFQQQDRYLERYVETRCQALAPHSWGFVELEIEHDLLNIGKLGLRRASGVFPDGTPLRMPDDDPLPAPLEIEANIRDEVVYLALPLRRAGGADIAEGSGLARHVVQEIEASDSTNEAGNSVVLEVGRLHARLLRASDVTGAYACIPLAHVVECQADKKVVLSTTFMPTVLDVRAAPSLDSFLHELVGLLHQRGEALSGRVSGTARGATAEIAELLLLQAVNGHEPIVAHFAQAGAVHPESFYRLCVSIVGDLSTFTAVSRRPPVLPTYRHEQLRESFEPVIVALRAALSVVLEQSAVPLPIEKRKYGFSVAIVADRSLFANSMFVLAVRADLPAEDLRKQFPAQLKLGPAEQIRALVTHHLPGIPVHPVPVAPRQIPYHAGFAYFEVDRAHALWAELKTSGGLALHVAGDFPGLALELWAIRGA